MDPRDEPIAAAFAAMLKKLRTAAGLTMAELGERVSPSMLAQAIARYESGKRLPSWGAVVRLARALGVTPDAFLPGNAKRSSGA
ncbi:MAG TPA: helix-turn-helix transcriptional regulator [Gemmataceae bacterium]|nr:helix-turn-helix transcriptional regulator [Gemmataceae bacterium]